jgi:hypothetical protein
VPHGESDAARGPPSGYQVPAAGRPHPGREQRGERHQHEHGGPVPALPVAVTSSFRDEVAPQE